jgi:ATP-dependent Clp protease adapter protein ClpS
MMFIMTPLQTFLCTLVIAATANAFTATPIHQRRTRQPLSPLYQSGPDKGGGSAIATPKTKQVTTTVQKQKQKNEQKQKSKPSEPDLRNEEDFEDAPMYRLYLIGDEGYEQEHVVNRVFEIIEDCSEDDAARLFKSAYQTGEAFMGKYPREIAETYAEQLTRSDPIIYADVRDDEDKKK